MKNFWGLLIALLGLSILVLWVTGKIDKVWADIKGTTSNAVSNVVPPYNPSSNPMYNNLPTVTPLPLPNLGNTTLASLPTGLQVATPTYIGQPSLTGPTYNAGVLTNGWGLSNPNPNGLLANFWNHQTQPQLSSPANNPTPTSSGEDNLTYV